MLFSHYLPGYLLSTALAAAESNEDMEVDEDYEERSSTLTNSDSEDDEHEEEDNLETLEEEATIDNEKEFLTILEIESQTDIDLIENNFALQKMMVPRLISSKSYLQLFKNNCQIKSLSIEAFNSLTGICEYQIHLNLEGEHSLIQVIYENMVVPIRIVMKLTNKENELDALALKNKYMQIESGCISSLTNARKSQTNLLYTLQVNKYKYCSISALFQIFNKEMSEISMAENADFHSVKRIRCWLFS